MKLFTKFIQVAVIIAFLFSISIDLKAQKINWVSFEEAIEKSQTNPKKIIIDIYTDWCKWCKVMDNNTFANPIIANK